MNTIFITILIFEYSSRNGVFSD